MVDIFFLWELYAKLRDGGGKNFSVCPFSFDEGLAEPQIDRYCEGVDLELGVGLIA